MTQFLPKLQTQLRHNYCKFAKPQNIYQKPLFVLKFAAVAGSFLIVKMPNKAKDHEDCRKTVCFICMKKATRELTQFQADRVKKIFEENLNFLDQSVPRDLCSACRITLLRKEQGKDVELPSLFNFKSINVRMATRDQEYHCIICQIGHSKLNEKSPLESKEMKDCQPQKRCSTCLSLIGKGLTHNCNQFQYRQNLKQLASEDPKAAKQIASQVITTKDATPGGSVKISQPQGGRQLRVRAGNIMKI